MIAVALRPADGERLGPLGPDHEQEVRLGAVRAMVATSDGRGCGRLASVVGDTDPVVARAAAAALVSIPGCATWRGRVADHVVALAGAGRGDEVLPVAQALLEAVDTPEPARERVREALARIGDDPEQPEHVRARARHLAGR